MDKTSGVKCVVRKGKMEVKTKKKRKQLFEFGAQIEIGYNS